MDISTLVMLALALILYIVARLKVPEAAGKGILDSLALFLEIVPRIIAAFIIAGLVQALLSRELIVHWMGQGSGVRGLSIAMTLGFLTPGGPMIQFPIIASFYQMGIGIGPLVAYLTAWSLFGFQRIIMWEIPFLGPQIVLVRVALSLFFPFVAGWLSEWLWVKFDLHLPT